ncbi:MAG: aldose 1-epimerase family protein [Anaerolineae bacterium]|nr:aldose 1-epimerase family protein [Anaerolineae bacterium]
MINLYGRSLSREELLQRVGDMRQVAGVRLAELADGPERGVRVADVHTGSGFSFTVLLDRGMDIGSATYNGRALAWQAQPGEPAPTFYEPEGLGWLRTFHGGLVATCGLTQVGAPCEDQGEALGLHGRIGHIPARHVYADAGWDGDEYVIWIQGKMRETVIFGEDLLLARRISARLGESRLFIEDTVENIGHLPTPHMMLYHCNFGWPLIDEGAELIAPSIRVEPRDAVAAPGLDQHAHFGAPQPGYAEQVFFHEARADADGYVTVALANRSLDGGRGFGAYIRYRQAELPRLIEWKQMGAGTYVVGIEPANCLVMGRAAERERGTLVTLQPGEKREYRMEIGVLPDNDAIDALAEHIRLHK